VAGRRRLRQETVVAGQLAELADPERRIVGAFSAPYQVACQGVSGITGQQKPCFSWRKIAPSFPAYEILPERTRYLSGHGVANRSPRSSRCAAAVLDRCRQRGAGRRCQFAKPRMIEQGCDRPTLRLLPRLRSEAFTFL
jgi:hypothetical protein